MKKNLIALLCVTLIFFVSHTVHAAISSFSDTFTFTVNDKKMGQDCMKLSGKSDNSDTFTYQYSQALSFSPSAKQINSAKIALTYWNNTGADNGEVWFLSGGDKVYIGKLSDTTGSWVTQSFNLPESMYSSFSGSSWTIALSLNEQSNGEDNLYIQKSVLSGTYTPTPIPAAAWLLGSGVLGMVGLKRRKTVAA